MMTRDLIQLTLTLVHQAISLPVDTCLEEEQEDWQ